MSSIAFEHNSAVLGSVARVVSGGFRGIAVAVNNYVARSRAERQLVALDDRLLNDIGLHRYEIRGAVWGSDR